MAVRVIPMLGGLTSSLSRHLLTLVYAYPEIPDFKGGNETLYIKTKDARDLKAGGICAISGVWFPASRLITREDGKQIGDTFYVPNPPERFVESPE